MIQFKAHCGRQSERDGAYTKRVKYYRGTLAIAKTVMWHEQRTF